MMADLARIKRNVGRMLDQGAPEAEIDEYIASEGVSVDDVRAYQPGHAVPEFQPVGVDGYDPATGEVSKPGGGWWDSIGALVTGAEDVPIIGPAMKAGSAGIAAGIAAPFDDRSYGEIYSGMRDRQEQVMRDNPGSALAGQVLGTTALMAPIGATAGGARALGMSGTLGQRALMSGVSGAGISGADTAIHGGDTEQTLDSALVGGAIGAGIPVIGAGLSKAYGAARNAFGGLVRGAGNPASEAGRRIGQAVEADKLQGSGLGPDDLAAAFRNNQPIMNADLGGENVRALARAAANQSPDARGMMERTVSDRFADQGGRVQRLISRITGGKIDDFTQVDAIRDMAAASNKPAYNKAFTRPSAQAMWHEGYEQLMQAPAMQRAARTATTRGANRAAVEGFQPIRNPFTQGQDGRLVLKVNPDGSRAQPNLQFWNQVKRNLDGDIGRAQRAGDRTLASDIMALKKQLVGMLDESVPEYRTARQGAAAFFGAEDAVDAGRNFAKSSRSIPEFKRGILAMKPAEREAFRVGFASELIDQAKAAGDRTNVINRMFGSQEAREKLVLAFGPQRAKEVEAFVRVETAMDALRGAFGNSTTARQLTEMGLIGGGAWWFTGDFKSGISAAALSQAPRYAAKKIDERVMVKMAEMLLSNDTKMIERAVANAAMSPQHMAALDALTKAAGITARSTNLAVSGR